MSSNGRIAVSVLLGLQLLVLITLACYIYSTPTWSPALDALAVLRMGSSVSNLPALGLMIKYQSEELQREDGLIGVVDDWERDNMVILPKIALGAPGLINRKAKAKAARSPPETAEEGV